MSVAGKSLDKVNSTGPGNVVWADTPKTSASLQVSWTGSPSDVEVSLECSLDGVQWKSAAIYSIFAGNSGEMVGTSFPPFLGLRANLTTLSGGSSPTVTVWVAAA